MYDSTYDTEKHIAEIKRVFNFVILPELEKRKENHDQSKLVNPEKECYDKYIPMLKEVKFGSKEYVEVRNKMHEDGLKHHFEVNRHHPEHFPDGIESMTLIDIVEMFCDWMASSKYSDTSFKDGLKFNKKKFKMSEQLYNIFLNTYKEYF